MSEQLPLQGEKIDLSNCDREPIHIPGTIQAFGALLALDPGDFTVLQASASTEAHLGVAPERVLGVPFPSLLPAERVPVLERCLATQPIERNALWMFTSPVAGVGDFHLVGHLHDDVLSLELEPRAKELEPPADIYALAKRAAMRLTAARTLQRFCQVVAEEIRAMTGFDRVMVYRFLEDKSGEVLAEDAAPGLERFLGLHYPATDVPKQARELFRLNAVRIIADVRRAQAPMVPAINPRTGRPLDMSFTSLRGVSPIHVEYLTNMGVRASMSLAIATGDELWGLIACHHYSGPRLLPIDTRAACELISRVISLQIMDKEANEHAVYRDRIRHVHDHLMSRLVQQRQIGATLTGSRPDARDLLDCGGAAVLSDGHCALLGRTPDEADVRALAAWVAGSAAGGVFRTDGLPALYPPAERLKHVAAGLLAAVFSRGERGAREDLGCVLWFRPEVTRLVSWAGDPHKPVEKSAEGERLTPRRSFQLWKETVEGFSVPWRREEIDAARRLQEALVDVRHSHALARLNEELARSNTELDAFAYVASHDLKEPLRGIYNYSTFLLEDYSDKLDVEAQKKLATLLRLAKRMQSLIDSLLHFSRVGKGALTVTSVALDEVVAGVCETLAPLVRATNAVVVVPRSLPHVRGDPVRIHEVLENLISNALKYNDKQPRVEIGWEAPPKGALAGGIRFVNLFVRDNGIGIPARHHETIFRIFKRLHTEDAYRGGTGAGLTIARRIVELHGGRMWLESVVGVGSTFWFSLPVEEEKS